MERIQRVEQPYPDIDEVCVFCQRITVGRLLGENRNAVAFRDSYPLNPGHIIICSRRHESNLFKLDVMERQAMFELLDDLHEWIMSSHAPDGFNIGANIGEAGGQNVDHAHLHLIPRYTGDIEDPSGGVRWILPDEAKYW